MRLAILFAAFFCCTSAYSKDLGELVEVWSCKSATNKNGDVVLSAGIFEGREYGVIRTAGINNPSTFDVYGVHRAWQYEFRNNGKPNYSFIMDPTGLGYFFTYKGLTEEEIEDGKRVSSYMVKCNQITTQRPKQE